MMSTQENASTEKSITDVSGLFGTARRLVTDGIMSIDEAKSAIDAAFSEGIPLTTWLIRHDKVESMQVAEMTASEFGIPIIDVTAIDPRQMPIGIISENLIEKHEVLPLFKRGNSLFVGLSDPGQARALDDIRFHSGCQIELVLIESKQLTAAIKRVQNQTPISIDGLEDIQLDAEPDEPLSNEEDTDLETDEDAPIVSFVNKVLVDSIRQGASDIHFEPYEGSYRIRVRKDGVLHSMAEAPVKLAPRISSRLKVISGLDIAEKRVPQDGRAKLRISKKKSFDFRVSTLPTLFGEKIVLRILDSSALQLGIEKLGYEPEQQKLYLDAIKKPYGMVLVTGPTGSGKSVSLYTALNILNTEGRNISTVEDPVEIRVEGINQVQQNTKRGLTFAAALRSFLRQDPDVIMVGEIRDTETAEIAIKAAQTGHMVLSTLHTNDAAQTVARLMNMGIAPYNITSSVTLVVAQRLARCLHSCKRKVKLPDDSLRAAGFSEADIRKGITTYEPTGCRDCTNGYKGRTGIYQIMPMLDEIQQIVLHGGNAQEIAKAAQAAGVDDLRTSALNKVKQGIISLTEADRITLD